MNMNFEAAFKAMKDGMCVENITTREKLYIDAENQLISTSWVENLVCDITVPNLTKLFEGEFREYHNYISFFEVCRIIMDEEGSKFTREIWHDEKRYIGVKNGINTTNDDINCIAICDVMPYNPSFSDLKIDDWYRLDK